MTRSNTKSKVMITSRTMSIVCSFHMTQNYAEQANKAEKWVLEITHLGVFEVILLASTFVKAIRILQLMRQIFQSQFFKRLQSNFHYYETIT